MIHRRWKMEDVSSIICATSHRINVSIKKEEIYDPIRWGSDSLASALPLVLILIQNDILI